MIAVNDLDLTEHRYFFSSSTSGLPAVPPVMPSLENTFRMKPALSSSPGFGSTGPTMTPSAILGPNMIRVMGFSLQGDIPPDSLLMDPWEVSGFSRRFFLSSLELLVHALLIGEWGWNLKSCPLETQLRSSFSGCRSTGLVTLVSIASVLRANVSSKGMCACFRPLSNCKFTAQGCDRLDSALSVIPPLGNPPNNLAPLCGGS